MKTHHPIRVVLYIVLYMSISVSRPSEAAVRTWVGNQDSSQNNSWDSGDNWNPGSVPGVGDTVFFNDTAFARLASGVDLSRLQVRYGDVLLSSSTTTTHDLGIVFVGVFADTTLRLGNNAGTSSVSYEGDFRIGNSFTQQGGAGTLVVEPGVTLMGGLQLGTAPSSASVRRRGFLKMPEHVGGSSLPVDPAGTLQLVDGFFVEHGTADVSGGSIITGSAGSNEASIGRFGSGGLGVVNFNGGTWTDNGLGIFVGGDSSSVSTGSEVSGVLNISSGATFSGLSTLKVWSNGVLNLAGAAVTPTTFDLAGGELSGNGSLTAELNGSGTIRPSGGVLSVGDVSSSSGFDFSGTIEIESEAELLVQDSDVAELGTSTILAGGNLRSTNGVQIDSGEQISGRGIVFGAIVGTGAPTGVVPSGTLIRSLPLNFPTTSATVLSQGAANLGPHTTLGDGTINATVSAPNGIFVAGSSILQGPGVVQGRISAALGSTIDAGIGDLTLGDTNSPTGFFSDGDLHTGINTVTINDANEAVLGSLTNLGDDTDGGTLVAGAASVGDTAPHFLVEQGKNLTGRGTIEGNFKNNGHVIGDGSATNERLVFGADWTVSGIGTFENTLYLGTFAPGLSPAVVEGENFAFAGRVQMELGGTTPGSGTNNHDQILDSETIDLHPGVELEIKPWNGFEPQVGDAFELLRSDDGLLGVFDHLIIDPFFQAMGIDFELLYTSNSLTAVAIPVATPGDFTTDGIVDGKDFLYWQRNPGAGRLADWQANYGADSSTVGPVAVPEPSTMVCLVSLLGLRLRFRRFHA